MLASKNLIVFGGTGSFGQKVATLLAAECNRVKIFSRDEKKQHDMRAKYPDFEYIIGDVRDYQSVKNAMRNVNVVFQAAALKQVPSCESYPEEALKTNCLGVVNICNAAKEQGVEKVVALSTDKATLPINAMGISKALAEKIVVAQPREGPIFSCVRYGNILNSRGSVVPYWLNQVKLGKPVTITDVRMTRFLMNLRDSVDLVKTAIWNATGGEVFVKKAPAANIAKLAQEVLQFIGKPDYPVVVSGRRPGEKLHEFLISEEELYRSYDLGGYAVLKRNETATDVQLSAPLSSETAEYPKNLQSMLQEGMLDMEATL